MVTLTESAVKKFQEFLKEVPGEGPKAIRLAVYPGGCSGYQYSIAPDTKKEKDSEVKQDGFSILVDEDSAPMLKGAEIDFIDEGATSGFKIENPNAKSGCGCGSSCGF